jgi:hypothetical protein
MSYLSVLSRQTRRNKIATFLFSSLTTPPPQTTASQSLEFGINDVVQLSGGRASVQLSGSVGARHRLVSLSLPPGLVREAQKRRCRRLRCL